MTAPSARDRVLDEVAAHLHNAAVLLTHPVRVGVTARAASAALRRGVARDATALGGPEAAQAAYETRYLAACRLYLAERDPERRSTVVVAHDDVTAPRVVRLGPSEPTSGRDRT